MTATNDLSLPPYFSTLGASLLQPCQGSRAAGTPKSGAWNGNQCPPCRTAANKIGRKQKREQKKQKAEMEAEEKELLRELVIAKKKRLTPAAVAPAPANAPAPSPVSSPAPIIRQYKRQYTTKCPLAATTTTILERIF